MNFLCNLEITIVSPKNLYKFIFWAVLGLSISIPAIKHLVDVKKIEEDAAVCFFLGLAAFVYSLKFIRKAFAFKISNLTSYFIWLLVILLYFFHILISRKKKSILLVMENYIFSLKNEENFSQFVKTYNALEKEMVKFKILFPIFNDWKKYKFIKNNLESKKQIYVKNIILKNYDIIFTNLKTKNLALCEKISIDSLDLKNALNEYKFNFDANNKVFSKNIIKKLDLIIDFTNKYKNGNVINVDCDIDSMEGRDFEKFCANLLMLYGFSNAVVTPASRDQGVDITGYFNFRKYAIQCKRYSARKVDNSAVQEVVAGRAIYDCSNAMVITNNYFTDSAIQLAKSNHVVLWDRKMLKEVIYKTDSYWQVLLDEIRLDSDKDKF